VCVENNIGIGCLSLEVGVPKSDHTLMAPPDEDMRLAVGVMTGTSIDAFDAALVRIEGNGLDMKATLLRQVSRPLGSLVAPLRAAAEQTPMTSGELATLAWDFGRRHVEVIEELLAPGETPDLIAAHGQTVFHQPPVSWQLINPAPIEHRFGCPVLADLRQADLAAGGQGAPITPLADWIMFRSQDASRAIINLGGFCNVTLLQRDSSTFQDSRLKTQDALNAIRGFDLCPCNHLLDAIARKAFEAPFDEGGRHAASGAPREESVASLLELLRELRAQGRSLGTGDEALAWIDSQFQCTPPADLAASVCVAIARMIAESLGTRVDEIVLAGGGTRNAALSSAIQSHTGQPVTMSDKHGVPAAAREAMAMAILGTLSIDDVSITLPQVTAREPDQVAIAPWSLPT
jgi:1,6-anhydro-N-acetylmuramate kinase